MRRHSSYSLRRLPRSSAFRILFLLYVIWDSLHCISLYLHQQAALSLLPPPRNEKRIYIAAQHWNSAQLLRSHWNTALSALVQELGIGNVFVSIYESGSYDDTKDALRELDATLEGLQVRKSIMLSDVSHADEVARQPTDHGWIKTLDGETHLRRIPYLASIRNKVFEPLERLAAGGEHFDMILFLNDIVFSSEDVLRLLDTNGGEYAAACSMDFSKPPQFYDTFALRDSSGHEALMQTWPYFRSYASRYAAQRFMPVPVASCWNGMVAMPIEPFLGDTALRFRGIPDSLAASHLEASECCLIHADNPSSASKGVFLNLNVEVGYNGSSYDAIHSPDAVMSPVQIFTAVWQNRLLRWGSMSSFKRWVIYHRVKKWFEQTQEVERGEFCLVDETQVLYERGWKHV
ncbi:Nn.00g037080.m01.CDS01 [Neocucurbitaria sp. VM-36]